MKSIYKFICYIDYLIYNFIISQIPFKPGNILRYLYFKIKMGNKLGRKVEIAANVKFGSRHLVEIDDGATLMNNCIVGYKIGGKIKIHRNVLVGHDTLFINNLHEYRHKNQRVVDQGYQLPHKEIVICEGVWIGARVIILPGVMIGKNSIIGAGALVSRSIPKNVIALGVPARPVNKIKYFDDKL